MSEEKFQKGVNRDLARHIVDVLNDWLDRDQDTVNELMAVRVPCGQPTVNHPSVQCGRPDGAMTDVVGVIGLLNGIAGACPRSGWGAIAAVYSSSPRLVGGRLVGATIERFEILEDRAGDGVEG